MCLVFEAGLVPVCTDSIRVCEGCLFLELCLVGLGLSSGCFGGMKTCLVSCSYVLVFFGLVRNGGEWLRGLFAFTCSYGGTDHIV